MHGSTITDTPIPTIIIVVSNQDTQTRMKYILYIILCGACIKSMQTSIMTEHSPFWRQNHLKLECDCPCVEVIIKQPHTQTSHPLDLALWVILRGFS